MREKYVRMYEICISQLQMYANATKVLSRIICHSHCGYIQKRIYGIMAKSILGQILMILIIEFTCK